MEPILLYGIPAGSSMGLIAALEWQGRPYRLCRVDMLGQMREPSYARINPRRETPVLVTERGDVLTETMAIAAHLEARDVERRISFDPLSPEADRMHQIMGFINSGFTSSFGPLWMAMEMDEPDPSSEAILRRVGRRAVEQRHDRFEEMLESSGPFCIGDHPTLADALLLGVARWREFHGLDDLWPRLRSLRRRIEADRSAAFALAIEDGESVNSRALIGHVSLAEVIERYGAPPSSRSP